jgi:glycosyltransferase involved in cell wall biosynthesis
VNQEGGGGATAAAREVLAWGPARGFDVTWFPRSGAVPASVEDDLDRLRPDIVHVHCWYQTYPYELLASIASKFPTVFTVHDVFVVNQYGTECWECYRNPWCFGCPALGPLRRWRPNYRVLARRRKRRVNRQTRCHLVFPSVWMQHRLARTEWRRHPASVIPYGVDTAVFCPGPPQRALWGLPPGPLALFVGHMYSAEDHRKGLPDLLGAWPSVRDAVPDAGLVVAGRTLGLVFPPGVIPLGDVPPQMLPDLYRSVDLLVLPTRGDNLPVAVLEAQASGLPVVGTRVGGVPEQVSEGVSGLLVPSNSPPDLAKALTALLRAPDRLRAFGEGARECVMARFSRERSADLHDILYRSLVD